MILWVDAQISPAMAPWITEQFGIEAYSVKWLGYRDATDQEIFHAANARMKEALRRTFPRTIELLEAGEPLVEISDAL